MRVRSPVSRASLAIRFSIFDVAWAAVAPWLALWARGAPALEWNIWSAATYCAIAFLASIFAFLVFRIRDGMTHLFSVHDALQVAKAVVLADSLVCLITFSATRLDSIPRSTPFIHALILAAGLVLCRALMRALRREQRAASPVGGDIEHVIVIGSNRLSALYIGFLRAYGHCQINGVLDDRPEMLGRSVAGAKVLGPTAHLGPLMQEFLDHGIQTDRVLVGTDAESLDEQQREQLRSVCSEHQIALQFIPDLVGLSRMSANPNPASALTPVAVPIARYFRLKRYIDFGVAFALLIALAPLFALAAALVLIDMGAPVFFWQRRIGMHGHAFQLHKFRTLKPSFDQDGLPIPSEKRISPIGGFLRKARLDELPQLLNVLVGDMSLIGPRPLLTEDQPADPRVRLSVRPGISGWAQVNGGKTIDAETKNRLDEWYVRHASLWLDLKIVFLTVAVMFRGEAAQIDPASLFPGRQANNAAAPEQHRVATPVQ
jgi:lipopolysaccharide/colanic/teichoic acid biosynthesis glycosyltransferase